jgi:hypothetical protein
MNVLKFSSSWILAVVELGHLLALFIAVWFDLLIMTFADKVNILICSVQAPLYISKNLSSLFCFDWLFWMTSWNISISSYLVISSTFNRHFWLNILKSDAEPTVWILASANQHLNDHKHLPRPFTTKAINCILAITPRSATRLLYQECVMVTTLQ